MRRGVSTILALDLLNNCCATRTIIVEIKPSHVDTEKRLILPEWKVDFLCCGQYGFFLIHAVICSIYSMQDDRVYQVLFPSPFSLLM